MTLGSENKSIKRRKVITKKANKSRNKWKIKNKRKINELECYFFDNTNKCGKQLDTVFGKKIRYVSDIKIRERERERETDRERKKENLVFKFQGYVLKFRKENLLQLYGSDTSGG
jgi:hypothetical protein